MKNNNRLDDPGYFAALCEEADGLPAPRTPTTPQRRTPCDNCGGTGQYRWGAVINGRPTHSGVCFRCGGKGHQTPEDKRRNHVYDLHRIIRP